ncbi:DUF6077 domain-containing protein [Turicibacter bilis]|nr:DUF6077 domain-containing protein [Turicibacter bilis]
MFLIVIVFLFIFLLLASIAVGLKVNKSVSIVAFDKIHPLSLGFFVILGIYQLIAWPFMLLHFSTTILAILTSIIILALVVLIIREWCALINYLKQSFIKKHNWLIICCFILFTFLYTILRSLDTYWDFNFYLPLIGTNVESDFLNVIDPWSGQSGNLSWMYNYQGYYVLMAMLSKLFSVDSTLLMIWLPSLLSFLIFPCVVLDGIELLTPKLHKKYRILSFMIVFFLSVFNLNFLEFSYYGANYRLFILSYLLLLIMIYLKHPNRRLLLVTVLIMTAHLSTHSTALFISVMILLLLFLYLVWFRYADYFNFFLVLSSPVALYVGSVLYDIVGGLSIIPITFLLALYCLVYRFNQRDAKWWFSFLKIMSLLIVIGIFMASVIMIVMKMNAPVTLVDFYQAFIQIYYNGFSIKLVDMGQILVNMIIVLLLACGFNKKDDHHILYFMPLATLILFFNPIVAPFISSILTGIVYDRTIALVISNITVTLAISQLADFKYRRIMLSGFFLISSVIFINDTIFHEDTKIHTINSVKTYNLLYKQPIDLLELDEFLNDYTKDKIPQQTRIISYDFRIRLQSRNHILVYTVPDYRELELDLKSEQPNLAKAYDIITRSLELEKLNVEISCISDILLANQVNLVIVPSPISSDLKQNLNEFSQLIYENNSYQVYEVNASK